MGSDWDGGTMPTRSMSIAGSGVVLGVEPLSYRYTLACVDEQRTNGTILSDAEQFVPDHDWGISSNTTGRMPGASVAMRYSPLTRCPLILSPTTMPRGSS